MNLTWTLFFFPPVFDQLDVISYEEVVQLPAFNRKTLVLIGQYGYGEGARSGERDTDVLCGTATSINSTVCVALMRSHTSVFFFSSSV